MLVKASIKNSVSLQYQLIKLAWSQYHSAPESLSAEQFTTLEKQAQAAQRIITAVLGSEEAKREQVIDQEVQFLIEELQQQFDNIESYQVSLQQQGLSEAQLYEAIYQDIVCEKTLATQSQDYTRVSEQEAQSYYQNNKQRFAQPERRQVSHILITINDDYADNERHNALAKIEKLQRSLQRNINEFANLALQHSECPTSLNKGLIGNVSAGQLYPELDSVLFTMKSGEVSSIIESEIGFHLLLCHQITGAAQMHEDLALQEIRNQLNLHRQKKCEKKWLHSLLSSEAK